MGAVLQVRKEPGATAGAAESAAKRRRVLPGLVRKQEGPARVTPMAKVTESVEALAGTLWYSSS